MPDDRPSFGQALADVGASDGGGFDSPAEPVTAAPDASASSAEALATDGPPVAAPTAPPDGGEPSSTPGPIPWPDHKRVLEKQRSDSAAAQKALEDRLAALAWAQEVPTEHATAVADLVRQAGGNPVEFGLSYLDRLLQNPEHAAAIRSHAARLLGRRDAAAAPPQPETPPGPPPPTMEVDGIALYSAADLAKRDAWFQQQLINAVSGTVGEQIAPMATLAQRLRDAEAAQAREAKETADAKAFMESAAGWHGLDDATKKELGAIIKAGVESGRFGPMDGDRALMRAYIEDIVPKLVKSSQGSLLRDLKTQALTGPSPASATPLSTPSSQRPRSFREYFEGQRAG